MQVGVKVIAVDQARFLAAGIEVAASVQPGAGYFYSPGYTLADGHAVHYTYLAPVPDDVTAESNTTTTPYANWATNEPNNYGGNENNLVMNSDGTWNDVSGDDEYGYVLYKADGTYTYVAGPFTFADAVADANSKGGLVAFPTNAAGNQKIQDAANGKTVWLNASDSDYEGF